MGMGGEILHTEIPNKMFSFFSRPDDDLDKIMDMKLTTKDDEPELDNDNATETVETQVETVNETESVTETPKPVIKPKPALKAKPAVPKRSEHLTSADDTNKDKTNETNESVNQPNESGDAKTKPPLKQKPLLSKKPDLKPKPGAKPVSSEKSDNKPDTAVGDLSQSDIMKYIQDNTASGDDLDLFS